MGRFRQRSDVDGAQAGIDGAVHVGQGKRGISEHQKKVCAEGRAGQRQPARGVVETDVTEHDDDGRDNQRQKSNEFDIGPQARQFQPHPIGGGHNKQNAEDDGEQRHHDGIAEGFLKTRIGKHLGIGVEGIFAAPHFQREVGHADQRQGEIEQAENQRAPGEETLHFSHLSLRARSQI
ncbi:hypothetical protein D3C86_1666510 [compost metagenome]